MNASFFTFFAGEVPKTWRMVHTGTATVVQYTEPLAEKKKVSLMTRVRATALAPTECWRSVQTITALKNPA